MEAITFVRTGGTIDKEYPSTPEHHGREFLIREPAYNSVLVRARMSDSYLARDIMQKDSLDMTDEDREAVRVAVGECMGKLVIVTHGTDTIHLTAKALVGMPEKTIVLTGAMQPEKFRDSDADFNIGMAVGAIPYLFPGVYIALSGRVVRLAEYVPT